MALYLAAEGLGRLRLIDPDQVEISNLPRQILFGSHETRQSKAQAAAERLRLLYPSKEIKALDLSVGPKNAASLLSGSTVVIDCTDRFAVRPLVNAVYHQLGIPLVIGSALQWSGQLLVVEWTLEIKRRAWYACLFPKGEAQPVAADAACGAYGVISTTVGLVGPYASQGGA